MIVKSGTVAQWESIFQSIEFTFDVPTGFNLAMFASDFRHYFANRVIYSVDYPPTVESLTNDISVSMPKYSDYLNAYKQAIETEFDPLVLTKLRKHTEGSNTDVGDVTTQYGQTITGTKTGTDIYTPSETSTIATVTFDEPDILNDVSRETTGGSNSTNYNTTDKDTHSGSDAVVHDLTHGVDITEETEGFDNIDYINAIQSKYTIKLRNWYDAIYQLIAGEILTPAYEFDFLNEETME